MFQTKTILAAALVSGLALGSARATDVTPAEARAIAKEAYIYGPMSIAIGSSTPMRESREPRVQSAWNQIRRIPRVYTPDDKAVQTPNSDTPYSIIGMDVRADPRADRAGDRKGALLQHPVG